MEERKHKMNQEVKEKLVHLLFIVMLLILILTFVQTARSNADVYRDIKTIQILDKFVLNRHIHCGTINERREPVDFGWNENIYMIKTDDKYNLWMMTSSDIIYKKLTVNKSYTVKVIDDSGLYEFYMMRILKIIK